MKFFEVRCFNGPCADQLMPCGAREGNDHARRERMFGHGGLKNAVCGQDSYFVNP